MYLGNILGPCSEHAFISMEVYDAHSSASLLERDDLEGSRARNTHQLEVAEHSHFNEATYIYIYIYIWTWIHRLR